MNQMQPTPHRIVRIYHDDEITVTNVWVVSASGARYRIADLTSLVEVRGGLHAGVFVSLAISAATALMVIVAATLSNSLVPMGIGGVAILIPLCAAATCAYRWPPSHCLRARYHGFDVQLFCTRDAALFRKVARALIRAQEVNQRLAGER